MIISNALDVGATGSRTRRWAMSKAASEAIASTAEERERMHALYRQGGRERQMAPHIVYPEASCPHDDCDQPMQAIDFRLEDHGRAVHDPLVRAWWDDTGFAGRCPRCGGWIHFTIRGKRAITPEEAAEYPQLPDDWHAKATIL
jgi:hypothetical protein